MPAVSHPQSNPIVLFSLLNSSVPEFFFSSLIKACKVTLVPLRSNYSEYLGTDFVEKN